MTYARFAAGFPRYLRFRVSLEDARAELQHRLAHREENFLRWVEKGVFGVSRSPYRPLFAHVGCELGDLRQRVRDRGLEATLEELRDNGLYVSYEEFKGREPMVRGGREIPVAPGDFDNPFLKAAYQGSSSGSTGPGTRVRIDLDSIRDKAVRRVVADEIAGLRTLPFAIWRGGLPAGGLGGLLTRLADGRIPERWFNPFAHGELRPSFEFRLATAYVLWMSRACGVPLPRPEPVPVEQAETVARWVHDTVAQRGGANLRAYVSMLVRVSQAAQRAGLDLTGAVLSGGGEPPTPAKVAEIERSGARYHPGYGITEFGTVGLACRNPAETNDLHVALDHLVAIQRRRQVPGWDVEVDALLFTTLLPSAPKLAINVETDDYGVLERRACGCPWQAEGFPLHVRGVRSFRKLTGEGITLIGSDVVRLLEETLPRRFGGSATDYQLVEGEGQGGLTTLTLRVSPGIELASEAEVLRCLMDGLSANGPAAHLARATWEAAGSLRLERGDPIWTGGGKLMPLHLASRRKPAAADRQQGTAHEGRME